MLWAHRCIKMCVHVCYACVQGCWWCTRYHISLYISLQLYNIVFNLLALHHVAHFINKKHTYTHFTLIWIQDGSSSSAQINRIWSQHYHYVDVKAGQQLLTRPMNYLEGNYMMNICSAGEHIKLQCAYWRANMHNRAPASRCSPATSWSSNAK